MSGGQDAYGCACVCGAAVRVEVSAGAGAPGTGSAGGLGWSLESRWAALRSKQSETTKQKPLTKYRAPPQLMKGAGAAPMTPVTVRGGFARPAAPQGPGGTEPAPRTAPRGARVTLGLAGQPGEPPVLAAIRAGTSGLGPCAWLGQLGCWMNKRAEGSWFSPPCLAMSPLKTTPTDVKSCTVVNREVFFFKKWFSLLLCSS